MVLNALAEVKVQMETTTLTLQEELQRAKDATRAAQEELEMKRKASPERISTMEIKLVEQQRLNANIARAPSHVGNGEE